MEFESIHSNQPIQYVEHVLVDNSHSVNNYAQYIDSDNFAQSEDILPPISQLILKLTRQDGYYLKREDN